MVGILPSSDLLSSERCVVELCVDDFLGRFAKAAGETIAAKFNFVKSRVASAFCGCKESVDTLVVADARLKSARRIGFGKLCLAPFGFVWSSICFSIGGSEA